ncbi:MAG: diheme cytochrome c [Alphaproteobacteria bacterium]|nr:diheme cytochrome c [Alphaproteobacteria bacterium]
MRKWIILAVLLGGAPAALADERLPPITNEAVKKECGACHMAFQPQFLPQRSWRKMMDGLSDHFGEDASLPEATRLEIAAYLEANAGDVSGSREGRKFVKSIAADQSPMRITEVPRWVGEHRGEVRESAWSDPRVRSKANCVACHRGADSGWYDDD